MSAPAPTGAGPPAAPSDEAILFEAVFAAEKDAVNARRARHETAPPPVALTARAIPDERGQRIPIPAGGSDLTGLSLSGGGIRSAAFCLGVLQGLDAAVDDSEPQLLDTVDYLSTVSGGGYMGAALVTGLMQTGGRFPFASKSDQNETIETQHLRDYANFLAPAGPADLLIGVAALLRGLLVNATVFLSVILLGAIVTVALNPDRANLAHSRLDFTGGAFPNRFLWTTTLGVILLLAQVAVAVVGPHVGGRRTTLPQREALGRLLLLAFFGYAVVVFLETQALILDGLFDAHLLDRCPQCGAQAGRLGTAIHDFRTAHPDLPSLWTWLVAVTTGIVAFGGKLMAVAKATLGDTSWTGFLKHWASRLALYLAAVAVPLVIWAGYLALSYDGIGWTLAPDWFGPHAPAWLRHLAEALPGHSLTLYGIACVILTAVALAVTPNATSLHGYYRDRLGRAFLWRRDRLLAEARVRDRRRPALLGFLAALRQPARDVDVDTFRLSSLKRRDPATGAWPPEVAHAPYLLINAAVNLEGSKYLNRRGRNADSFFFSPLHVGSEATRYVATPAIEALSPAANIAAAMAISGAAASANMGASTIRVLTFSLAALNVRLGFWLPNPRLLSRLKGLRRMLANIGPIYFTRETFGLLDELAANVYLTDGGHFDNLGLYELLKRRCKVIVAVDAEADPPMNFESLVRLQRYARIDLGVRIDLPWEDLRRSSRAITGAEPHGPHDDPSRCAGPHVALGRIDYGPGQDGVLIYVKACLSGDESDLIRDYRRRNATFPHETTLDQFFTEEQFEVYRALGFHATKSFFTGQDHFAMLTTMGPDWADTVRSALRRLQVPGDAIARIVERQQDGPRPQ